MEQEQNLNSVINYGCTLSVMKSLHGDAQLKALNQRLDDLYRYSSPKYVTQTNGEINAVNSKEFDEAVTKIVKQIELRQQRIMSAYNCNGYFNYFKTKETNETNMKQLRLTTKKPNEDHVLLAKPNGKLTMDEIKGEAAYIHGEAERIAGFDMPFFVDGNLGQLDLPIKQQDILLLLPSGEYKCKAEYYNGIFSFNCYLITLVTEPSVLKVKQKDNK